VLQINDKGRKFVRRLVNIIDGKKRDLQQLLHEYLIILAAQMSPEDKIQLF